MKRRTILVPLDGSDFSRQIIPAITDLLDPQANTLILLRVAELPVGISSPPWPVSGGWVLPTHLGERDLERVRHPIYADQEEESARAAMTHELSEEARPLERAGYSVRVLVRFGEAAEEIIDIVRDGTADMVAMATHSRSGLSHFVLGSVAEQVLRGVDVPVMLLHPHTLAGDNGRGRL
jgi:nucleotide-binding universal stress UspA family protein